MKTKDKIIILTIFMVLILLLGAAVRLKHNFKEKQSDEKVLSSDIIINVGQTDESKMAIKSTSDDNKTSLEEIQGNTSPSSEHEAGEITASVVSGAGLVKRMDMKTLLKK